MEIMLTQEDDDLYNLVLKILEEWRDRLYIDSIWDVAVRIVPSDHINGSPSLIGLLKSANYYAEIKINYDLFSLPKEDFVWEINKIMAHELVHLVAEDFMRLAIFAASGNNRLIEELKHKYEQFTTRLQKSLVTLVLEEEE